MEQKRKRMKPTGLHHITAIAGDPRKNVSFYRDLLGLRLVKQTVNFDDPSTYHLYYGDRVGTPGTAITFFPWGDLPRGRQGAGLVVATAFSIAPGSLGFWKERLEKAGVTPRDLPVRFGEPGLRLEDPDGLVLELIETDKALGVKPWAPDGISESVAIHGFHSATGLLRSETETDLLLTQLLGAEEIGREGNRIRYALGEPGAGHYLDLAIDETAGRPLQGKGTVHHIAFSTPDDASQEALRKALLEANLGVSPVMDRNYFHSIYFREPQGILFEVATEGPGFAIDEPEVTLGESLKLPGYYESQRELIEARLPRIMVSNS